MPYIKTESDKVITWVDDDYKDFDSLEEYIVDCDLCERPLSSVEKCDGYMFFVADQPLINQKDIEKLIRVFRENKDFIVIPKYKEKHGNPVIYPSLYKEEILRLEGDKGGKSIIKSSNKIKYVEVEEDTLFDIDNKDDFNKLLMRKGHNE